jgi:Tfp pilus assembly protein PilX
MNKKGVALYFVLAIVLIMVILANIILNFITSQNRLTTHQVKRVQAIYAAQAGVNYAIEQLRLNNGAYAGAGASIHRICGPAFAVGCEFTEPTFPPSINFVDVNIGALNMALNNRTVNATVNFTSN